MPYDVSVKTGDVSAKASAIRREAEEIEVRLTQLTTAMGELAGTWTGVASNAFQEVYASWKRTADQMKQSLESLGLSLQGAGEDYDLTETGNRNRFQTGR